MPQFKNVSVYNPILVQSASSFMRVSEITPTLSSALGHYTLQGDDTRRGIANFTSNSLRTVLLRRSSGGSSANIAQSEGFTDFADDFNPGPAPGFKHISNIKSALGYIWILGVKPDNNPHFLAVPQGSDLTVPGNYLDLSGVLDTGVTPTLFTKCGTLNTCYFVTVLDGHANRIVRGYDTSSFAYAGTLPAFIDIPTAYVLEDYGEVQMLFTHVGAYRSLNYGQNWTSLAVPLNSPVLEATYSRKFDRWCISNGTVNGIYTSRDNGTTWSQSQWVTSGDPFSAISRISHLERLDFEGRYILAISGFRTGHPAISTYLSADGGASWTFSQVLKVPNYGNTVSANASTVLVNTGSHIVLYQGDIGLTWNFDNSAFVTPLMSFSRP